MRSFSANNVTLLGAALVAASLSSTAYAQTCQASATQCATETDNILMHCESGTWSSEQCDTDMTCMTMGAMIHCMLTADGAESSSTSTAMPTSTTMPTSMSMGESSSTSGAKSIVRGAGSIFAVGMVMAGMAALF
ncbi:hypothetical protein EV175_003894 [Coemansia sp. RSA 1933]|nr:hypothetical protein EV175_003894 [Coemansia sp. RSA 1933]